MRLFSPPVWAVAAACAAVVLALSGPMSALAGHAEGNHPTANDDEFSTEEDTDLDITLAELLANDEDPDEGDVLEVLEVGEPAHGTLADDGAGTLTYTPDENYHGDDSFEYTLGDGTPGSTDVGTVLITVEPVNDPPEAEDDAADTGVDTPVDIDVLGNDSDVDDDELTVTDIPTPPANGDAVINEDGTITYTPDPGFNGDDSFIYTIFDGTLAEGEETPAEGSTADAEVLIRVLTEDEIALSDAMAVCDASEEFTHPSLRALCKVLAREGFPEGAAPTIAGVVLAHAEKTAPGWLRNHGPSGDGDGEDAAGGDGEGDGAEPEATASSGDDTLNGRGRALGHGKRGDAGPGRGHGNR